MSNLSSIARSRQEDKDTRQHLMPFQRTRYCFRIARSDHAFGSITEWMSSIAQRPRSQTRSYRISFSRYDLRTQLSGVSAATTLACEASRESVFTLNLLTSSPCE